MRPRTFTVVLVVYLAIFIVGIALGVLWSRA